MQPDDVPSLGLGFVDPGAGSAVEEAHNSVCDLGGSIIVALRLRGPEPTGGLVVAETPPRIRVCLGRVGKSML